MGRIPCCEKDNVKRGQWTPEEDDKLASHIAQHGTHNWRLIPKSAGLQRCGKSCRLRWTNYLRPDLKHGEFSEAEEQTIMRLHAVLGNRWSIIAAQLPGRTDNDVKNYWNTKLKKKLSGMGIDPVTHKPFSHLMAEIATALPPPQVAHLAEATLGCFKDEMLYLLTKKRFDFQFQLQQSNAPQGTSTATCLATKSDEKGETVERIRRGLSRAILEPDMLPPSKPCEPTGAPVTNFAGACGGFPPSASAFQCGHSGFDNEGHGSPWNPSICTGSTCNAGDQQGQLDGIIEEENGQEFKGQKDLGSRFSIFNSDCVLWELPTNDHMNPIM